VQVPKPSTKPEWKRFQDQCAERHAELLGYEQEIEKQLQAGA
jgi:hypothetical protein